MLLSLAERTKDQLTLFRRCALSAEARELFSVFKVKETEFVLGTGELELLDRERSENRCTHCRNELVAFLHDLFVCGRMQLRDFF